MICAGIVPAKVAFASALSACTDPGDIGKGKHLHAAILGNGFGSCLRIATCLLTMYARCGDPAESKRIFDGISAAERDLVCWNALISSHSQHGLEIEALRIFCEMHRDAESMMTMMHDPNRSTFVSVLDASAAIPSHRDGILIHHYVVSSGLDPDLVISTAACSMYGRCGDLADSLHLFFRMQEKDAVLWNTAISVLNLHDRCGDASWFAIQMQTEGLIADRATVVGSLDACESVESGRRIHARSIALNLQSGAEVGSALVKMYGKFGDVREAERVFDRLRRRDALAWTAMIAVCAQNGRYQTALRLFQQMQKDPRAIVPDKVSYLSILPAYAGEAGLADGRCMHATLCKLGLELDQEIANALISMYAKCGSLDGARNVFEKMRPRDVVSWNAMIAAYAQHGRGREALDLYDRMREASARPDCITYISIFLACSHSGLLEEGRRCLASMTEEYGIELTLQHYNCLIDLLARAGQLDAAETLLQSSGCLSNYAQWVSLLGACRSQSDVERGERAAARAFAIDPTNTSPRLMLSHIYARAGMER
jgi:pentatricopeptide repeat protein